MGGECTQQGDYLLPNLTLPEKEERTIGVWGQRRLRYLKQHHKILYYNLLTSGKLHSHPVSYTHLAIARAAVADPPVMIMDEATSSIDTRTEAIVQRGMDALMTGRTVFVIAHRLSTVRNANAIMVLDHGRIIERGTHEDLIKLKGTYYQLYTGALELD